MAPKAPGLRASKPGSPSASRLAGMPQRAASLDCWTRESALFSRRFRSREMADRNVARLIRCSNSCRRQASPPSYSSTWTRPLVGMPIRGPAGFSWDRRPSADSNVSGHPEARTRIYSTSATANAPFSCSSRLAETRRRRCAERPPGPSRASGSIRATSRCPAKQSRDADDRSQPERERIRRPQAREKRPKATIRLGGGPAQQPLGRAETAPGGTAR
jgi:hypothetical protein